jgi:GTP pyrophosphokinase
MLKKMKKELKREEKKKRKEERAKKRKLKEKKRLKKLKKEKNISFQAENFRKMLLTLNDDIRVIIIKIADRLHNMQTLEFMTEKKQLKIASETLYIYAPIAHRIGMYNIKNELEDLGLKFTKPEIYKAISLKLNETINLRNKYINKNGN